MESQTGINANNRAKGEATVATPFRRMLVAIDESTSAQAALALVAEWVDGPGADVRIVGVSERHQQRRSRPESDDGAVAAEAAHRLVVRAPTLGARNRQLVKGIAAAAEAFGADVIVLGLERRRLAGHRLAPSVRQQLVRTTDLPVLVAPAPQPAGTRHHRLVPELHHDREQADTTPRYERV